jgi:hypothetical protein
MGYVKLRPRIWPSQQDEEKRREYIEKLDVLMKEQGVEIWYQDECGVQGDPKPRRIMCLKGSRPRIGYTGKHLKENVIGAVRPCDGTFISLIMPYVDTEVFQIFIDEMQKHISEKKVIMIMDNASWHKTSKLNWGNIIPFFLPPYSPDFNPIERIWLNLKQKFFSTFVAKNQDDLSKHLVIALRYFISNPDVCFSICGS